MKQLALFTQHKPVALTDYDYIVISSSGGKDSQAFPFKGALVSRRNKEDPLEHDV